jgi:hypothetical protein
VKARTIGESCKSLNGDVGEKAEKDDGIDSGIAEIAWNLGVG